MPLRARAWAVVVFVPFEAFEFVDVAQDGLLIRPGIHDARY